MIETREIAWLRNGIARLETRLDQMERASEERHRLEMVRLGEILDLTIICNKNMQQAVGQRVKAAAPSAKPACWDIPIPDLPRRPG
jgi:hypothetical protein